MFDKGHAYSAIASNFNVTAWGYCLVLIELLMLIYLVCLIWL